MLILVFQAKFSKALNPPPQKKNVGNNKRWYFGSWVLQQICTTWQVHISFFFKNHSTLLLTSIIFRSTCHQHDMIKIEELHFLPTQKQLLFILSFVSNLQYTYDVMYIFCFVHKVENRIEDLNNKTNCHLLNTQCKVSWCNTCPVLFRKHNSKTIFLLISWRC